MTKAIKAALLSACVFPGAGHLFLKKYRTGVPLAVVAAVALYVVISAAVDGALQIVDKIQRGEVYGDIATITELVSQQSAAVGSQSAEYAMVVFIVAWLIGIADSYRVGRLPV